MGKRAFLDLQSSYTVGPRGSHTISRQWQHGRSPPCPHPSGQAAGISLAWTKLLKVRVHRALLMCRGTVTPILNPICPNAVRHPTSNNTTGGPNAPTHVLPGARPHKVGGVNLTHSLRQEEADADGRLPWGALSQRVRGARDLELPLQGHRRASTDADGQGHPTYRTSPVLLISATVLPHGSPLFRPENPHAHGRPSALKTLGTRTPPACHMLTGLLIRDSDPALTGSSQGFWAGTDVRGSILWNLLRASSWICFRCCSSGKLP